jgi:RNA polymerase sigma factor (sigma-70 family)
VVTVEDFRKRLTNMSMSLCSTNGRINWQDLAQEGSIEIWRLIQSGETREGILMVAARRKMIDALIRAKVFRKPETKNTTSESVARKSDDDTHNTMEDLSAIDSFDAVERAYHNGMIHAAIDKLSPAQRKYVTMRFFMGLQHPELEKEFGYNPGALWSSKKNGAKYKLAVELESLREFAA